jgi:hypothetical protein
LQAAYLEYLSEYLEEILSQEVPDFESIRSYKSGLVPISSIVLGISGTYQGQIHYMRRGSSITFLRQNYDHTANDQSQRLKLLKAGAITAWNNESIEFKEEWSRRFNGWYQRNFYKLQRMITPYLWYVGSYVNRE